MCLDQGVSGRRYLAASYVWFWVCVCVFVCVFVLVLSLWNFVFVFRVRVVFVFLFCLCYFCSVLCWQPVRFRSSLLVVLCRPLPMCAR